MTCRQPRRSPSTSRFATKSRRSGTSFDQTTGSAPASSSSIVAGRRSTESTGPVRGIVDGPTSLPECNHRPPGTHRRRAPNDSREAGRRRTDRHHGRDREACSPQEPSPSVQWPPKAAAASLTPTCPPGHPPNEPPFRPRDTSRGFDPGAPQRPMWRPVGRAHQGGDEPGRPAALSCHAVRTLTSGREAAPRMLGRDVGADRVGVEGFKADESGGFVLER